jgi:hypothetical protein
MLSDGAGFPVTAQTRFVDVPLGIEEVEAKKDEMAGAVALKTVTPTGVAVPTLPEVSVAVAVSV